ncbi:GNAT family N-acetyltransferase [Microvirga lenta]|uniref:GNAT family N-acetyltransferase n=1 Tax=Microvirga lenta TaxID=2881337 RepID=UPI001CFF9C6F|nr:hypothetical protein [Microvirga lenta]
MSARLRNYVARHGLASTLFHVVYRLANSAVMLMVFQVVVLARGEVDWELAAGHGGQWGFLGQDELKRLSRADPSLELDEEFLSGAFARGDRCFAFIQDGILGAYAWYAVGPTPIQDSLTAVFGPGYVYMYKAFTAPAFRGRRLYGMGIARAMQALLEQQGFKGLVSCVQSHNRPSQKGLRRIGFRTVGRILVLGGRRPCLALCSPGCRSLFCARIS